MRKMDNLNQEDAKKNGWNVLVDLKSEIIGKATFEEKATGTAIMKSTKRFQVPGGWIYNTSTEIQRGINISVAEALVFVPSPGPSGMGGDTRKP